jgi:hypothetical protein
MFLLFNVVEKGFGKAGISILFSQILTAASALYFYYKRRSESFTLASGIRAFVAKNGWSVFCTKVQAACIIVQACPA